MEQTAFLLANTVWQIVTEPPEGSSVDIRS